jgi:DNA-damage-inducible protein D
MNSKIILFQEKSIRRQLMDGVWFFNVVDVIETLTDSPQPRVYWSKLRKKMTDTEGVGQMFPIWKHLKFEGSDGKNYRMDAADTEGLLRIIMSVPSPKAEPFKLWLAQVGREHIEEIENPELAVDRARELYKAKGYSDEWIATRLKSIEIRQQLTDEWQNRGVKENQEYAILTAEISKATFGLTPSEYKEIKNLKRENLRDHMTNLELIFTMLGEEVTRDLAVQDDAQGFNENFEAAHKGGTAAGDARKRVELTRGKPVVSTQNFLDLEKNANNLLESDENTEGAK